ncbi:MAG: glycosyltransferase [Nitrososphaeria archaeon]
MNVSLQLHCKAQSNKVKASIIVCTKNRPMYLAICLQAIKSAQPKNGEIIVVDSSCDSFREENRAICQYLKAKYYYENRPKLAVARNRGIDLSKGDIVIFVDDDFIINKRSIKNLIRNYSDSRVVCCTGRILANNVFNQVECLKGTHIYDRGNERRVFSINDIKIPKIFNARSIAKKYWLNEKAPVPWSVGSGFCSFKKNIFKIVGYFDESLGTDTRSAGEDVDMFYRILKKGYYIIYEPSAIAYHNISLDVDWTLTKAYIYAKEKPYFFKKYYYDSYMIACFFGYLALLNYRLLRSFLSKNSAIKKIIKAEYMGFLSTLGKIL